MSNKIALKVRDLDGMTPVQLVEDERVEEKFVTLYNSFHGSEMGAQIYQKEKFNFLKLIQDNKELQKCTKLSLYGCFLDVAYSGLSLEQGTQPHVYLLPYNVNAGTKDKPVWEKRASLSITGYGELIRRIRAGHIKEADNPIVVYDTDKYERTSGKDGTIINWKMGLRTRDARIVACFMRMVRPNGQVDFAYLEQDDWERLATFSAKKNRGAANALYTSGPGKQIDKGFLIAKTIKHAFKSYPKIKIGDFSALQTENIEDEAAPDYGLDVEAEEIKQQQAFGPDVEEQEAQTVTVETSEEDDESGF